MKPKGRKKKSAQDTSSINLDDDDTTCSVCLAEFVDPDDLIQHAALVHTNRTVSKFRCNFCLTYLNDLLDLSVHVRDYHLSEMKICKLCTRGFDIFSEYSNHKKLHRTTIPSKYKCSQCKIIFRNYVLLQEHEIKEHDWPETGILLKKLTPYFQTVFCNDVEVLLSPQKLYTCRQCSYKSQDLESYIKHLKKKNCRIYACENCHKIIKLKPKLRNHCKKCTGIAISTLNDENNIIIDCKTCFKAVKETDYKQHIRTCKSLKCKHCDVVLSSLNEYTQHQRLHPASIIMKTCRYCNQLLSVDSFYKHVVKAHENTYKSYKYNCVYCNKIFNHPQKLFGHFLGQHRDIEPYTCKICNKKFKVRTRFTIHIKIDHKSKGHVEFDENFSVYFVKEKSENPFVPRDNPFLFTADELADKPYSDIDETDINTDVEISKLKNKKRLETDLETENEMPVQKPKVFRKRSQRKPKTFELSDTDSDSEPLIRKKKTKKKLIHTKLTCNLCNKRCYTLDNYNRHMTFHFKKESKQCIKCAKLFKTVVELKAHMAKEHSSSQLIKTLQELLAKRKSPHMINLDPQSFDIYRTMRKVISTPCATAASISLIDPNSKEQSARNYLESFYLDNSQSQAGQNPKTSTLTMEMVTKPKTVSVFKPNIVKYKEPTYNLMSRKLKMPVKYRAYFQDNARAKIKLVRNDSIQYSDFENTTYVYEDQFHNNEDDEQQIPEVAEEVYLENTVPHTQENSVHDSQVFRKLVIPNIPEQMDHINEFRIGHIQPQAPFIQITPISKLLIQNEWAKAEERSEPTVECLQLASGTKLVRTNPLAHLLGKDTPVLLKSQSKKYYTPKITNVTNAMALALMKLKETPNKSVGKRKSKKVVKAR